ncbi:BTAD domain-containing putative transcriptional regulator [Gordonia sp. NPDC003504]
MLEYLVLGPLEVRRDGVPVELGSPKQRTVLAALLLARGGVVSSDRLIDTVWGDEPPSAATTSLQAYISNLRRALRGDRGETSPIQRVAAGYRLDLGADRLDLVTFGDLVAGARAARDEARWADALADAHAARSLWRGELLGDEGTDAGWIVAEAAALAEARMAVEDTHITALLAAGDTGGALAGIVALRARDPLRDRGVWLHMVALYRAGRSTEALEVYRRHAATLDEELGLAPSGELIELQGAVLRHDPVIAAWPRAPHWSGATEVAMPTEAEQPVAAAAPSADDVADDVPLVGRAAQTERIAALFDGPATTRWLMLSGPAGIGKTRLAEEAARHAQALGDIVVWVRCPDAEGVPAWWPLRQLCRALNVPPEDVLTVPAGVDADTARFAVYEHVQTMLESMAPQSLTVIVDDVHWADAMTLRLLAYLTTVMHTAPLRVIATARDGEGGDDTERLRTAFSRAGGTLIAVPQLARAEVAELVRVVADETLGPTDIETLTRRTGGNPLFVSEFARLPPAERRREMVPAAVRSVLDRRLLSLDPAVLEVVGYAAVLGEEIDVTLLAMAMDRDVAEIADCLDEAVDERILVTTATGGRTRFAHALLRDEAASTIRPLRRCRIHLRFAEVLAATGGVDAAPRRAAHLLEARPVADAAEVVAACRAAADEATAQWDSQTAAFWLDAALRTHESVAVPGGDTTARDDLLIALLAARARAGQLQMVLDTAETRLYQSIRSGALSTVGRLASSLIRAGGSWPWMGPTDENESLLAALSAAATAVGTEPASLARVLAASAIGHCYHHDPGVPAELLAAADDLAAHLGEDVLADVTLARLITYAGVAEYAAVSLNWAETLRGLTYPEAGVDEVIVDAALTMATMTLGDIDTTEALVRRGIAGSERLRLPIVRAQLRWMEMSLAAWHGDFSLARSHYETAVAVHEQTELYVAGSNWMAMMALACERGMLDEVVDTEGLQPLDWARRVSEGASDNQVAVLLAAGIARIAGAEGDRSLARTMITMWVDDDRPMVWTSLCHGVLLAHVVAELELSEFAPAFIDYLTPYQDCVATLGHVGCVGPVALALAELHYLVGDEKRGYDALVTAHQIARQGRGVPSTLRCRLLAAQLQPPSTERSEILAEIEFRSRSLGMTQVAATAGALLAEPVESGGTPDSTAAIR